MAKVENVAPLLKSADEDVSFYESSMKLSF